MLTVEGNLYIFACCVFSSIQLSCSLKAILMWICWPLLDLAHPGWQLWVCFGVYFVPSSGQTPLRAALWGRTGTKPWWLYAYVHVCGMKWERDLICARERSRGLSGDSRGNGSAPSSTVLLRWWIERSVCRRLSAVALAKAAAREHGQLLWWGETTQLRMGQKEKSSYIIDWQHDLGLLGNIFKDPQY